jgi:putative flippase GtrA
VLYLLSRWAEVQLAVASALAVELAAVSNYLLYDSWTFAARTPTFRRFAKFIVTRPSRFCGWRCRGRTYLANRQG